MHIPSPFRDRRTSVELQLTPMIDCVFLLMIYFIWSSNFGTAELSLPSKLSALATIGGTGSSIEPPSPEADFPETVVRILWNGNTPIWTVNNSPVGTLGELRQMLAKLAGINRGAPVILDPAGDVPLGSVIEVFDLSRVLGFEKVRFATEASGRMKDEG